MLKADTPESEFCTPHTQGRPSSGRPWGSTDLLTPVIMCKLREPTQVEDGEPSSPQWVPSPSLGSAARMNPKINRGLLLKGGAQLFVTCSSTRTQLALTAPSSCVSLRMCVDARSHTVWLPAPPLLLRSLTEPTEPASQPCYMCFLELRKSCLFIKHFTH